MENKWLEWAMELQSIAQSGLTYTKDRYDKERFERIREIAAEMVCAKSDISMDVVKDLFCNEMGYQTPKIETRTAIIENDKILLVKDRDSSTWDLPGGWVDITQSLASNALKETKEEAGLDVAIDKLIAIHDRDRHNLPRYAYKIIKVFFLCKRTGGKFSTNLETSESGYFSMNDLPELSTHKNTAEQIKMCFDAYYDANWVAEID